MSYGCERLKHILDLIGFASIAMGTAVANGMEVELVDFSDRRAFESWVVINDGVMGGFSRGRIVSTDQETALFTGSLSLANNGGFASVRKLLSKPLGVDVDGLVIRVKGDGKRYRVRLYMNDRFEAVSYQAAFDTIRGKWVYIRIRTNAFYPSYRGRFVRNAPVLEPRKIQQIGFVIADKQSGPFSLELDRIVAYRKERRRK